MSSVAGVTPRDVVGMRDVTMACRFSRVTGRSGLSVPCVLILMPRDARWDPARLLGFSFGAHVYAVRDGVIHVVRILNGPQRCP